VPRLFGRLWRSGGRRAEVAEEVSETADAPEEQGEIERRIEAARERLRQTIPSPEDPDEPQT
jgi:hypothetical protein